MIKDSLGRTFYSHAEGKYSLAQDSSFIAQGDYNDGYKQAHAKYAQGYYNISGDASWKNAWEAVANMGINAEEAGEALKTVSKALQNVQSVNYDIQPAIDDYNYDWKISYVAAEEPKENVVSFKPNTQLKGCKICLAYDTEENWSNSDRILLKGEVALVEDIFGRVHMRVGNGEDLVLNCPKLMC